MLALVGLLLCGRGSGLTRSVHDAVVFQQLLHLLVGIAAITADNGVRQVPRLDVGIVVHDENDAVAQLLLIGAQRADEVTEVLGQHGNGAVNEIDARGALLGFLVDDAALLDVVAHVGNVDSNLI